MDEGGTIVWWALLAGGLVGGFSKLMLDGQWVMPQFLTVENTGQRIWYPGFVGPLFLGPVAAFVVTAAAASAVDFQTAFDLRGFIGPFAGSIPAGIGATYVLEQATRARLASATESLDDLLNARLESLLNERDAPEEHPRAQTPE